MVQPGSIAAARMIGKTAATTEPMYGTKRMIAANMPQSSGLGMPMK